MNQQLKRIGFRFLSTMALIGATPSLAQSVKSTLPLVPLEQEGVPIVTARSVLPSPSSGKGTYFNVGEIDDESDVDTMREAFDHSQTVHLILKMMSDGSKPQSCVDLHSATIIHRLMGHGDIATTFRLVAPRSSPTMNIDDETMKKINETGCVVADVSDKMLMPVAWHNSNEELSADPKAVVIAENFTLYHWSQDRDRDAIYFNLSHEDAAKVDDAAKEGRPIRVVLFKPHNEMPTGCFPMAATIVKANNATEGTVYQLVGPPGPTQIFVPWREVSDENSGGCAIVQTKILPSPSPAPKYPVILDLPSAKPIYDPLFKPASSP